MPTLTTFSFAHMPKQPDAGRLAQRGTGMAAQEQITAKDEKTARRIFARMHPDREITASGIVGVGS